MVNGNENELLLDFSLFYFVIVFFIFFFIIISIFLESKIMLKNYFYLFYNGILF